jgi:hypothetical protein
VLRQIARLGHSVPSISPRAWAVAVYASADDEAVIAREAGFEGVACVDDAARALELYCELWNCTRLDWSLAWCEGLLDFVLAMQDEDGRWINFIRDWQGTPNRVGRTSVAGGGFWQARAMLALAKAALVFDDPRISDALSRGLPHLTDNPAPPDVRCLHVLTVLALQARDEREGLRHVLSTWCDELVACSVGVVLMNNSLEEGEPHLWAHYQEAALADASVYLNRPELLEAACRSGEALFGGLIRSGFDRHQTSPYDVATSYDAMTHLAHASGDQNYAVLANEAREWFGGRNPAGQPVYDRAKGRVADGIDDGQLNDHSGAESNIVAAQTLMNDVCDLAEMLDVKEVSGPGWT